MLISFSVKNFRIFKEQITLNLRAGSYGFNQGLTKNHCIKSAVIFGKNAGGKSSLAFALFDIIQNLTDKYTGDLKSKFSSNGFNPENSPIEFEYQFLFKENRVIYSYKKNKLSGLISEKLLVNDKTILSYDKEHPEADRVIALKGAENFNFKTDELKLSLLKVIKNNCILDSSDDNVAAFNDLFTFTNNMLLFWSLEGRGFVGFSFEPFENIVDYIIKHNKFAALKDFFSKAGIQDELVHKVQQDQEILLIKYHNSLLSFNSVASSGMKSLLLFFYWMIKTAETGTSLIFIDEFDAFYHFELSAFIINFPKKQNFQTILTTHNTSNLSNELLRPDCYFICSKDQIISAEKATHKELNEAHNLEKLYKGGTFGL